MSQVHDGFIYGLESLVFNGKELGYISNDGADWGGDDPSTTDIWAAQKRTAPVKELEESPSKDVIEFDLIELKPANIAQVMGGTVSEDGKRWDAPSKRVRLEGPVTIRSADGSETQIKNVSLLGKVKGAYGYSDVQKIHCKMTILMPEDGSSPYGIDTNPDAEITG